MSFDHLSHVLPRIRGVSTVPHTCIRVEQIRHTHARILGLVQLTSVKTKRKCVKMHFGKFQKRYNNFVLNLLVCLTFQNMHVNLHICLNVCMFVLILMYVKHSEPFWLIFVSFYFSFVRRRCFFIRDHLIWLYHIGWIP